MGDLSPKTQSKAKSAMRNKKLPRETNFQPCKELGLNLYNCPTKKINKKFERFIFKKPLKAFSAGTMLDGSVLI